MTPWGCYNRERKPEYRAKDGYWSEPSPELFTWMTRHSVRMIKDTSSQDCKHTQDAPDDPRCEGCKHQKSVEKI